MDVTEMEIVNNHDVEVTTYDFQCENTDSDIEEITKALPQQNTIIKNINRCSNAGEDDTLTLTLLIPAKNDTEIKTWIKQLEKISSVNYNVRSTEKCNGKYVTFKQRLRCQHKTDSNRLCDFAKPNRTRNTNCPSRLTVTLRSLKKLHRGKDVPNPEYPCQIVYVVTHNHNIGSADVVKFHKVLDSTKEKLSTLFEHGLTPSMALESLKTDIHLDYNDFESILADRQYCPDYNFCYNLYVKDFQKKHGPLKPNSPGKQGKHSQQYSNDTDSLSTEAILYHGEDNIMWSENVLSIDHNAKSKCAEIIENLTSKMMNFADESPQEVLRGLEDMKEKMDGIKTVSAFVSSCKKFGSGNNYRSQYGSIIPLQSTARGHRRSTLCDRNGYVKRPINKTDKLSEIVKNVINDS